MPIKTYTLTLEWAKMQSPKVRHLAFRCEDDALLAFKPGQFITIHFEIEGKLLRRSYSIATIPGESRLIEIAAGFVENGPGTKLLFGLQPGDQIQAAGPFGRLILRDEQPQRYILVATSTGVTPYRSMLPELAKRLNNSALKIELLLGVQHREDLLYGNEFAEFAQKHPGFNFTAHYSRENGSELKTYETTGYVQSTFSHLNPDPITDIVYLCGNPDMIDDAFKQLSELNFDIKNIRREKYISN